MKSVLVAILVLTPLSAIDAQAAVTVERAAELEHLLRHDCGSCHGMTLKGGLGPALQPEALQGKTAEFLKITIQHGRPGTPMPPWRGILTEEDIDWLVGRLLEGS